LLFTRAMISEAKNRLQPAQFLPAVLGDQAPEAVGKRRVQSMKPVIRRHRDEINLAERLAHMPVEGNYDGVFVDEHGREGPALSVMAGHQVKHKIEIRLLPRGNPFQAIL